MTLTLRELLEIPQIANKVLAGADGLDNVVVWAHACEMPEPWDWIGPEELLLTIGYCVPKQAADQVRFVKRLAREGLAGMAIGDDTPAPALSSAMLKAADELAFPLLVTGHTTPFSVIARAVATANQHEQLQRLARLSRLNSVVGAPARTAEESLLSRIAKELGHSVYVVDARYGNEILPAAQPLDRRAGAAIVAGMGQTSDRLPARLHLDLGGWSATCFPLPSSRPAMLLVPDSESHRIDPFAVLHVANLIAVEVERVTAERERHRQTAEYLFRQLLECRLDTESAALQLRHLGLVDTPLLVAAMHQAEPDRGVLLINRGIPHLAITMDDTLIVLLQADQLGDLLDTIQVPAAIGSSSPIHSLSHIPDATREARWAFQTAQSQGGGYVDYSEAHPLFLPRTVTEAQNTAHAVLGAVMEHDRQHKTELLRSLDAYLTCDRSWKRASGVLNVHKQTLGYRLAKIEEITGRRLNKSSDIAELWLALLALRITSDAHRPPPHTR